MAVKPFNCDIQFNGGSSLIKPRLDPSTLGTVGNGLNGQMYFETAVGNKRLWFYDEEAAAWIKIPRLDYAETVNGTWTFNRAGAPFTVGAQSSGVMVTGLNAEGIADTAAANYAMRTGSQSAAALTVVIRDSAGRAKVVAPSVDDDVANKGYVDQVAQGLIIHQQVACATTENITLHGEQEIDGVTTNQQRVLVKNQTNQYENGIYVSGTGDWSRAADENTWGELYKAYCVVDNGTVNGSSSWVCTVGASGTLGVDSVTHQKFFQAGQYYPGKGMVKDNNYFHAITSSGYSTHGLVYANTTSTLDFIAANPYSDRRFLVNSLSGVPAWSALQSSDISELVMDIMGVAIADSTTIDFTYVDANDQFSAAVRLKIDGGILADSNGLYTVQDIRTTASPTFYGLTLSGLSTGGLLKATSPSGVVALASAGTDYQAVYWDRTGTVLSPHSATDSVSIGVARPVAIASGGITIKGDSGQWAMEYGLKGSADSALGGFGAYGAANAATYYYIGSYASELIRLTSTYLTPRVDATRDFGQSDARWKDGYFSGYLTASYVTNGPTYLGELVVGGYANATRYGAYVSFGGRDQVILRPTQLASNSGELAVTT